MLVDTTNMGESTHDKMRYMVDRLNYLTLKYDEGHPEVNDKEWDDLYFTLQYFESLAITYCKIFLIYFQKLDNP